MSLFVPLFAGAMDSFEAGRIIEGAERCKNLKQALKASGFKQHAKIVDEIIKSAKNEADGDYLFSKVQKQFFEFMANHQEA